MFTRFESQNSFTDLPCENVYGWWENLSIGCLGCLAASKPGKILPWRKCLHSSRFSPLSSTLTICSIIPPLISPIRLFCCSTTTFTLHHSVAPLSWYRSEKARSEQETRMQLHSYFVKGRGTTTDILMACSFPQTNCCMKTHAYNPSHTLKFSLPCKPIIIQLPMM